MNTMKTFGLFICGRLTAIQFSYLQPEVDSFVINPIRVADIMQSVKIKDAKAMQIKEVFVTI